MGNVFGCGDTADDTKSRTGVAPEDAKIKKLQEENKKLKQQMLAGVTGGHKADLVKDFTYRVNTLFDQIDADGSGWVDSKELSARIQSDPKFCELIEMSEEESKDVAAFIANELDDNGDGQVSKVEFLMAMTMRNGTLLKAWITEMFASVDLNQDGKVTKAEFVDVVKRSFKLKKLFKLSKKAKKSAIGATFDMIDKDHNNELTMEELSAFMSAHAYELIEVPEDTKDISPSKADEEADAPAAEAEAPAAEEKVVEAAAAEEKVADQEDPATEPAAEEQVVEAAAAEEKVADQDEPAAEPAAEEKVADQAPAAEPAAEQEAAAAEPAAEQEAAAAEAEPNAE